MIDNVIQVKEAIISNLSFELKNLHQELIEFSSVGLDKLYQIVPYINYFYIATSMKFTYAFFLDIIKILMDIHNDDSIT